MAEKTKKNKIAWSDDLSYDSEEEREKERLALAELAEIEAPEKPSYTDHELRTLVSYAKRITTLYYLQDSDWNDDCYEMIEQFFMEPKNLILCIYFRQNVLTASLSVPDTNFYDMTYFLRQPDFIYSVDNFHDEAVFGTIVESVKGSLLKMLEIVYAPILQMSTALPNGLKHKLNLQIHDFLAKLTDRHYLMVGQTVIYVPREGIEKTIEDASSDKELVKRLENVVIHWIRQTKCTIQDKNLISSQKQLICPVDKLNFLIYRYENLSGLKYQIQSNNVVHITNILINAHSSYINHFQDLCEELDKNISETKSNIEYLQILKQPCTLMETASLEELPSHIYTILQKLRFIWTKSPYYNTDEKLTKLFSYLSNQVIIQCSVSIDLDSLFEGKTRTVMEELSKCIECCRNYKEMYCSISETFNEMNLNWNLDIAIIFNYVDSFMQRCFDMLEVCNGMIIFGRIDEKDHIHAPSFGSTRGEEFEKKFQNIEAMFHNALSKIENIKDDIFNVQSTEWCDKMLEFRNTTKRIEMLIENLVLSLLENVNNVEEAVQTLNLTLNYLKRGNLQNCLVRTTSKVWSIFLKDIEDVKHDIVNGRNTFMSGMPFYAGQFLQFYMRKDYLLYNKQVIDKAMWMPSCSNSVEVLNEYKKIIKTIDSSLKNIWTLWENSIDDDSKNGLDRTLLCYSKTKIGLLECNFNRNTIQVYKESYHWENMNYEISADIMKNYSKMTEAKIVYEDSLTIVTGYNRILISLSDEEKALFKPLIDVSTPFSYDIIRNTKQFTK